MYGIKIRTESPYFASFRKPAATSTLLTFSVPPFTTIRGLISNAMGLPRDDFSLQERQIKMGIKPITTMKRNKEMAKILKLKGKEEPVRVFSSSPMHREFLVEPAYYIYIGGELDIIKKIEESLKNPLRPLYIGTSDDLVDVYIEKSLKVKEIEATNVDSLLDGIFEGCTIEKIPYKFNKKGQKYSVEYKTISIPKKFPYKSREPILVYDFDGENVVLM